MANSRLYFRERKRYENPTAVGLSVTVRPEVEKKLSRVDIALVMQYDVQVSEDAKVTALEAGYNLFFPKELSIGVFSEDKKSGRYTLVGSERVKFKLSERILVCLKDDAPYVHSLYVPYQENLHVSVVAQLVITPEFDFDDFKYQQFKKGFPVELSCLADSGEESDFNYEEWKDTDWD